MGQITKDIITGICCALCGRYFAQEPERNEAQDELYEHGYPVACNDCFTKDCGYEKQHNDTYTF